MGSSSSFSFSGNFFLSQASSQCFYKGPWLLYNSGLVQASLLQLLSQGLTFWCSVFKGACVWGGSEAVLSHGVVRSSQYLWLVLCVLN